MEQSSNRSDKRIIVLAIFLILSFFLNIYFFLNRNCHAITGHVNEKGIDTTWIELEEELLSTISRLDKFKGLSLELDSLLEEAGGEIQKQKEKITLLHNSQINLLERNALLKTELNEIKKLKEDYLKKIDFILSENKQLKNHNTQLIYTVTSLSEKEGSLEQKVNTASALRAEYVQITTLKKRFTGKYIPTSLAKKTEKINICFSVLDNKVSGQGEKKIHLRILAPNGLPLGDRSKDSKSFVNKETTEEMLYTTSRTIHYTNEKQDICMEYGDDNKSFTEGTYTIEIYFDGLLSTTSFYVLR